MRNILALIGLAVVAFVGLGWYLNWYTFKTAPTPDGHRKIDGDLNTPKITQDINKAKEKIRDILTKDDNPSSSLPPAPNFPNEPTSFSPTSPPFAPPPILPPAPNKEPTPPVLFGPIDFPAPPPGSLPPPPPPAPR